MEGPSVLKLQVLLDRALFSPGMIDGRWGKNTENALFWFQVREGLRATKVLDAATYARLLRAAGGPATDVVRTHTLTAADVRGPFVTIPADIYEHAKLRCSCYESLTEKLTEQFHAGGTLLRKLNPGVALDSLKAGMTLNVPAIRSATARANGEVRQIRVSGEGSFLHALDAVGRILYHFPITFGSSFDPSPDGQHRVTSVHPDPWWHYQPGLLAHVPDDRPNAMIPPGPNSSVGRVWMSLSAPHYGIHGTKSPETIGYAQSAGCVRLTNWDVAYLSGLVRPGTPVRFSGTRPTGGVAPPERTDSTRVPLRLPGVRIDSVGRDTSSRARGDTARPRATPASDTARPPAAAPATSPTPAPSSPAATVPDGARTP
jgi:lipoprotein-anchoring transpeptidase ErfK/SrfK